jgi:N-acetylmuramoyl-L-alanine amidase
VTGRDATKVHGREDGTIMKNCTALLLMLLTGCAGAAVQPPAGDMPVPGTPEARRTPALPPIPAVDGPLALEVGYPAEGAALAVRDSNFIFGSTGSGRARLIINDQPVTVSPNGGFLAFLPVPADGVYRLRATRDGETADLERRVRLPAAAAATAPGSRISAPYPIGSWAVGEGESIEIGFRAPPGGAATVVLPDGRRVALVEQGALAEALPGDEFRADAPAAPRTAALVRYAALVPINTPLVARDTAVARPRTGSMLTTGERLGDAVLEFVSCSDTARAPLRLTVALLDGGRPRVGIVTAPADAAADWTVRGRNDTAGPFHYFWPAGTRLAITGERDGMYRVRLAGNRTAWVPAGDLRLLPAGAPAPAGAVGSVRFAPQPEWIDLRVPLPERLPFQVIEEERTLHLDVFGAVSRVNFFQYGGLDPLLEYAEWSQPADSIFRVSIHLAEPVFGYHPFVDATGALVLRVRRPPVIDPAAPLRGLVVAVNPGHGGADRATRGPTGLTEADANLYISLRLRDLLQAAGARVVMTRTDDSTVPLAERARMAADSGAHLFVSVHNNAFPDGVNPFTNSGTSMYYYHPRSAPFARVMQHELLDELGLRDIGYGRADLSDARPTWMPAVLSETMFMMVPEQESALRDPAVQERIARAHLRAMERFLRERLQR